MDGIIEVELSEVDVVRKCIKDVWRKCWVRKHMAFNVVREERVVTNILKVLSLVFACSGIVCGYLPPTYYFVSTAIWLLSTFATLTICMVRGGRELSLERLESNYSDQLEPLVRMHADAEHENRIIATITRFTSIQIDLNKFDMQYQELNLSKEEELSLVDEFNKLFE